MSDPIRLIPPEGIADQAAASDTKTPFVPTGVMRNVRPIGKDAKRRWSVRPGLQPTHANALPGPIQGIGEIAVASGQVLAPAGTRIITKGRAVVDPTGATGVRGSFFFVHPTRGLAAQLRDPDPTYETWSGVKAAWDSNKLGGHPSNGAGTTNGEKDYGGSIGVRRVARLLYWTSPTGTTPQSTVRPTVQWTALLEDKAPGGLISDNPWQLIVRALVVFSPFVYVAAGPYIMVFAAENIPGAGIAAGDYLTRYNVDGWATAIQDMCVEFRAETAGPTPNSPFAGIGNRPFLKVAYTGTPAVTGAVTTGDYNAGFFARTGIAEFAIQPQTPLDSLVPIVTPFGAETRENSGDWRVTALTPTGRGRHILAIDTFKGVLADPARGVSRTLSPVVWPDARPLFMVTTNDGLGYNGEPPNGPVYVNCAQIRASDLEAGKAAPTALPDAVKWTTDVFGNSRKTNWQGTNWYNDIYHTTAGLLDPNRGYGPETSLQAIACDDNRGNIIVGGSVVNGINIYNLNGADGTVFNYKNLGEMIPQHGIRFDRVHDRVVVIVIRNNAWPGASGRYAQLLWLHPDTLDVTNHFDLGVSGCDPRGVAVSDAGWVALATEYVP